MGSAFARNSAAVHWCWVTAHLYDQQICIGVIAVTQGCRQAVLQSSAEQWEQHFAQGSAAVHWSWVTAHLYDQQSTGQWGMHFAKIRVAVHWWWVTAHLYGQQFFIYLIAGHKHAVSLFCRSALDSGDCILPKPVLQCIAGGSLHTHMASESS